MRKNLRKLFKAYPHATVTIHSSITEEGKLVGVSVMVVDGEGCQESVDNKKPRIALREAMHRIESSRDSAGLGLNLSKKYLKSPR